MKNNKTVAIVPGSFDPITNGHINIAMRAAKEFDIVYLAVMVNDAKKYTFSIEERKLIAKAALDGIENIEVICSTGMLWRLAEELSADAIVKGYRNQTDYDYEMNMANYNSEHYPNARTILLKSDASLCDISSTLVREKILNGEDISNYVPPKAVKVIKDILRDFT
ncbi:MAG: pantetheine-phosphate adenylyltransferase [Clostridia bacterium]|nr:pantetheine-phosphate adenylyltransferase [Clostridia bacterium]